jgi:glycosyltransferase involved in cell wall biosynthesis
MRIAVITPYWREDAQTLQAVIASVAGQTYPCAHILVADGAPQEWIDDRPVTHIRLSGNCGDFGDTPRAVGSAFACGRDYDAVTYLDADNRFADEGAVERYVAAAERGGAVDLVIGRRTFLRPDGAPLPVRDEPVSEHIDTNCYFFLRCAFQVALKWCLIPPPLHVVDDRIMRLAVLAAGLRCTQVDAPTVAYVTRHVAHYRTAGEPTPAGAKDLASAVRRELSAWAAYSAARRCAYAQALGFNPQLDLR